LYIWCISTEEALERRSLKRDCIKAMKKSVFQRGRKNEKQHRPGHKRLDFTAAEVNANIVAHLTRHSLKKSCH